MPAQPFHILLVEDSLGDVRLVKVALEKGRVRTVLHVAEDGEQALAFLRGQEPHGSAPRPDLIFLDLNMPRKDGREALAEIKEDPDLQTIPVVILTTSDADRDVSACYTKHCNCYITKPCELDDFIRTIQEVVGFWSETVRLPTAAGVSVATGMNR